LSSESLLVPGLTMFMHGKFKVTGDMRLPMKLHSLLGEPPQTSALAEAGSQCILRPDIDGSPGLDAEIQQQSVRIKFERDDGTARSVVPPFG